MGKDIRILLVDDHQVVREGLRQMLTLEAGLAVVGQAANSEEALQQIERLSPDVVLMDIKMPGTDGVELTRQVKQRQPAGNVIMLTLYDEYLTQAIEAGATGYLLKDIRHEELAEAIRQVYHGELVISRSITPRVRLEYEERYGERDGESSGTFFEELQLIMPPPVEASQLMKFTSQVEDILQSRVLQIVGAWHEGTAVTVVLSKATPVADILKKLGEIPELEATSEQPPRSGTSPTLIKRARAIPRLRNRPRKTLFVTLKAREQIGEPS